MSKIGLQIVSSAELELIRGGYRNLLRSSSKLDPRLNGVISDTLAKPGGLIRAQLAWEIMVNGGLQPDDALPITVAIEYFHTASLLFDDLPCMDDSDTRRGQPCPHLKYGEAATILGALALINRAYVLIYRVTGKLDQEVSKKAADIIDECLGVAGILDGQCLDLNFESTQRNQEEITRAVMGKTVSLIRLALVLPAVIVEADDRTMTQLNRIAVFWGLSYQIIDDLKDIFMGVSDTGKTTGNDEGAIRPNLPLHLGVDHAQDRVIRLLRLSEKSIQRLISTDKKWKFLSSLQQFWYSQLELCLNRNAA